MHLTPLLNAEDLSVQLLGKALEWLQSTIGEAVIDERIKTQVSLRGKTVVEMFDTISPGRKG
ncbi:MAG TPA: hypothetical protein VEQ84_06355 [Vicinamibacteria bacterium]|nr:hypothetical protein [Vicinamibacteria bacterium]